MKNKDDMRKHAEEHPERWAELLQTLQADAQYNEKLSKLSDREISKLLLQHVWAEMDQASNPDEDLLEPVMHKLYVAFHGKQSNGEVTGR